jgi:hypothetical protein
MKHHRVQRFAVISGARQVILLLTRKCAPSGPRPYAQRLLQLHAGMFEPGHQLPRRQHGGCGSKTSDSGHEGGQSVRLKRGRNRK